MFPFASSTREAAVDDTAARREVFRNTTEPGTTAPARRPAPVRSATGRSVQGNRGETALLAGFDAVAVAAALSAAGVSWSPTAVHVVATPVVLGLAGLYRARLQFSVLDDLPRIVMALIALAAAAIWLPGQATVGGFTVRLLTPLTPYREGILLFVLLLGRAAAYRLLRWHRRRRPGRVVLLLGCDGVAQVLAEALRAERAYGLFPIGFIGAAPPTLPRLPVLAGADGLEKAIRKYKPLHLIVTAVPDPDSDLVARLRRARRDGLIIHVVPRLFEVGVPGAAEHVHGIPLVRLRPEPAQTRRWAVKRFIDVAGATLGLLVLWPILLVCAIAVLCESHRHGVLFRQERISTDGRTFTILKFRSLTPDTARESQVKWNINNDARLGRIGKLLRFSSLDELPQLFNVLRGDMSLVGPRPERPYFAEQFQRTYTGYGDRHRVPAGITGWAQIHGLRGDTSIEDRVRYDNHYIEHWSLGLDLKIILRTVGAMLSIHRV